MKQKQLLSCLFAMLACIAAKANNFTAGWTEEIFQGGNMEVENGDPADEVIDFADQAVETLCVANWDNDEDGKLSISEAAAVTNLGEVFRGNTEITSFDELQYFTGLNEIDSHAFDECFELTSVTIPESITTIGDYAFSGCTCLTSLAIPDNVTNIGEGALQNCSRLTSVEIPNGVTNIASFAFALVIGIC